MTRRALATCFGFLLVSIAAASCENRVVQEMPATVTNLRQAPDVEIRDSTGAVLLKGTFATTTESAGQVERTADLGSPTGSPSANAAKGRADVDIELDNGVATKEEMALTAEGLPAAASVQVRVGAADAGTFTTTEDGTINLRLTRSAN
jgi:hypothetical protein